MIKPSLSVFFPVYNEEATLKHVVKSAVEVLKKSKARWEIIIINDGSTDNSKAIATGLAIKYANIRVVSQNNEGYGSALMTGFAEAKNDLIVYTDSDGQFDFRQLERFLLAARNAAAVWGYREKRNDPFFRSILSKTWLVSLRMLFGLKLRDVNCGFKLVKRTAYTQIKPLTSKRGGMINAELAIKLKEKGFKISEVGVVHFPRQSGVATGGSLKVALSSYYDLLKLWLGF